MFMVRAIWTDLTVCIMFDDGDVFKSALATFAGRQHDCTAPACIMISEMIEKLQRATSLP